MSRALKPVVLVLIAILALPSPALALCKRSGNAANHCTPQRLMTATHQEATGQTVFTRGDSRCLFPVTVPAIGEALIARDNAARDNQVLPVLQIHVATPERALLVSHAINDGVTAALPASAPSQSFLCVFRI